MSIVSDGEHSSEEESEDEETAGKVVTKAGVEVYTDRNRFMSQIFNLLSLLDR